MFTEFLLREITSTRERMVVDPSSFLWKSSSFLSTVETDSLKQFIVDIWFKIEPDRTSRTIRSYRKLINMHLNFRFEYSSKYAFSVSYTSNLISSLRSERDNLQHRMICQKQDVSYIKFLGEDIRRKGDWGTC